jgi:hypothetical protein
MRAALWAVACMRLLDRPLIHSSNPGDLDIRNTRPDFLSFVQSVSNAPYHAPPSTRLMRGTLLGGRVQPLVRPPIDSIIRPARPHHPRHTPLTHPSCLKRYNAANHPPAHPRIMRAALERVGCIGLFGRGATLTRRAARTTHNTQPARQPGEPNHAAHAGRNRLPLREIGPHNFEAHVT